MEKTGVGEKGVPGRSTGLGTDLLMEVLVRGSGTWRSGNVDAAGETGLKKWAELCSDTICRVWDIRYSLKAVAESCW